MTNWKTTLFGGLASLCGGATQFLPQFSPVLVPLAAVFGAVCALFMKDANVTGGTVAATPEAAVRVDAPAK